ncbi:MAG: hypothetical protein A2X36_04685 [Elusimicrobia bacterium GWA2_69_24]|nr:MAG: hypothetical protein A2X36_04685 [Elusimicrobia bacterium GWA2_69_24]HBL17534.1 hypothetical protein [Elusimicrobiota bacterium]
MDRTATAKWCAAATCIVFLFLWEQVQATRLGYRVSTAQGELTLRKNRVTLLRLELDKLHAPDRLAKAARQKLGMAPTSPENVVFIGSTVARLPEKTVPTKKKEEFQFLSRLIE